MTEKPTNKTTTPDLPPDVDCKTASPSGIDKDLSSQNTVGVEAVAPTEPPDTGVGEMLNDCSDATSAAVGSLPPNAKVPVLLPVSFYYFFHLLP